MTKTFTSARKLKSLPVGAVIRFGEKPYGPLWRKVSEDGWREMGSSFFLTWKSESIIHYNNGRPYSVENGVEQ